MHGETVKLVDESLSLAAVCAVDVHPTVVISVEPVDDFSAFSFSFFFPS
jgi:hypothetical protein